MQWNIVKDRTVDRSRSPATTTIDPGVYPMLWVRSTTAKWWTHFWLPKGNTAFPRVRKFRACVLVPPADRAGFPPHTLSAIRCDGSTNMYFAAVAEADGAVVGVEQALVTESPSWSSAPSDDPKTAWPASCAQMEEPQIAAEVYFRDTAGMRTYP